MTDCVTDIERELDKLSTGKDAHKASLIRDLLRIALDETRANAVSDKLRAAAMRLFVALGLYAATMLEEADGNDRKNLSERISHVFGRIDMMYMWNGNA